MAPKTVDEARREEIIDVCLRTFIKEGLMRTSSRDLSNALNMQPSGLYYYFKSKDEVVVACAEEAAIRMEQVLINPVLRSLDNKNEIMDMTTLEVEEMAPMMRFFTQVCTTKIYREDMQSILDRLKKRHSEYAAEFARKLNCKPEEVAPYMYACVAIVSNYMIFGEEFYFQQPLQLLKEAVKRFRELHGGEDKEEDKQ